MNYRIRRLEARSNTKGKIVHLNSLKVYTEREQIVSKDTVIAEDTEVLYPSVIGDAPDCLELRLKELLGKFQDVLSDEPGQTKTDFRQKLKNLFVFTL